MIKFIKLLCVMQQRSIWFYYSDIKENYYQARNLGIGFERDSWQLRTIGSRGV